MRHAEAVRRLATLPATLPAPPAALMPVRLDTGERRGPAVPFGPETAIPSAVLILIAPAADDDPAAEADVLLIRRVDRGGHHGGQMALPGGRAEAGDTDATATALREAAEEVGLDPQAAGVRVLGTLEPFWIPVSGYRVTPILAVAARRPRVAASEDEVEEIVWAPLDAFLPGAEIEMIETVVRTSQGEFPLRFGAYPVAGHRVWGATARILGQLGALIGS